MFTAPLLRQDRSVPGDRIDGTLGSILFSQREFNGWLEQKPFIPTQEYVAGCRQREKIGFNDVFLHFGRALLQSYGHQASNGQCFMAPF